eukprot:CAMPEP_0176505406 /NCGR_PEP_ID=MMETSP0200_2-20121128/16476_1 /TAXON_ID=947934 /ORGANISM="Chaetoceros sp., Strain GSL56" /LENGTH=674 /DNA_ID=CAMNT_0017904955 /DNA_START=423 /DNA_END=2447 /DNA_ORIENTATION=-
MPIELGFEPPISMEQEQEDGDDYDRNRYDDYIEYEEDFVMDPRSSSRSRRKQKTIMMKSPPKRSQDIHDDYDYNYSDVDEDDDDDDESYTGNFWANPVGGMDFRERQKKQSNKQRPSAAATTTTSTTTRRTLPPPPKKTFVTSDAKKSQRKTFRSGNPPPPNIIKEFYDKLFWYGFDPDETTSAADRTMFGGTRGKFDGLGLLQDIEEISQEEQSVLPSRNKVTRGKKKRLSKEYSANDNVDVYDYNYDDEYIDDDEYDDDDEYYDDDEWYYDDIEDDNDGRSGRNSGYEHDTIPRKNKPSKRRYDFDANDRNYGAEYKSMTRSSRTSRKRDVSKWFQEEEEEYDKEEYVDDDDDDVSSRKDGGSMSPIVNILDSVFQIDPDQVRYQAEDYNRRLGLDRKRRISSSYSTTTATTYTNTDARGIDDTINERKRRKGFAYRYVSKQDKVRNEGLDDLSSSSSSWLDPSQDEMTKDEEENVIDVDATVQIDSNKGFGSKEQQKDGRSKKQKEQSWEDRAAAYERVPPKGILAWGPEGEIEGGGIDARTYAAKTAMEEIFHARNVFEKKEAVVFKAERELLQLKKEASIQKKVMLSMEDRRQLSLARDRLRMINFDIEDAARQLRRAKAEALAAIDKLESIEFRHWALLRQYEADQELEEQRILLLSKSSHVKEDGKR